MVILSSENIHVCAAGVSSIFLEAAGNGRFLLMEGIDGPVRGGATSFFQDIDGCKRHKEPKFAVWRGHLCSKRSGVRFLS